MEIKFRQYTGTKTIKAVPMTKAEAEKMLGKSIKPATPGDDGYLVEYPDGYRSWSPKKVFEEAYRVSETHVDRMKIELADLNERICKATKAVYTYGELPEYDRCYLRDQLTTMNKYAEILYTRIRNAQTAVSIEDEGCGVGIPLISANNVRSANNG